VSLVSAIPSLVNKSGNDECDTLFPPRLHQVQCLNGLALVDFVMIVQHLQLHNNEIDVNHGTTIQRSINDYQQQHQLLTYLNALCTMHLLLQATRIYYFEYIKNSNSTIVDILWPQSDEMFLTIVQYSVMRSTMMLM
jgi:hypothetical protein